MEGTVAIIAGNLMIVAVVGAIVWGGVQSRREMNETMRKAIESGQQLDPEIIAAINKPGRSPANDLRGGIVLCSLAAGLIVAGLLAEGVVPGANGWDSGSGVGFWVASAIVGAIGIGQLVSALVRRGDSKKDA